MQIFSMPCCSKRYRAHSPWLLSIYNSKGRQYEVKFLNFSVCNVYYIKINLIIVIEMLQVRKEFSEINFKICISGE